MLVYRVGIMDEHESLFCGLDKDYSSLAVLCLDGPECEGHGLQGNIVLPTNGVILVKFFNLAGLHVFNSKIGKEL